MAASDLPDEAVEDLAQIITHHITGFDLDDIQDERLTDDYRKLAAKCYAAGVPQIRAQVLAKVDAALRAMTPEYDALGSRLVIGLDDALDEVNDLRDTLGAGGDGEG